jgi:hypothetical protein
VKRVLQVIDFQLINEGDEKMNYMIEEYKTLREEIVAAIGRRLQRHL